MNTTTTLNLNGHKIKVIWSDPITPWFLVKDICKAFRIEEEGSFLRLVQERDKAMVTLEGQDYSVVTDFGACTALYSFTEKGSDELRRLVCLEILVI